MKNLIPFLLLFLSLFTACIGDDIVDDLVEERILITTRVDTIGIDTEFRFEARYTNNLGEVEEATVNWTSENPDLLSIDATGLAKGIAIGNTAIVAEVAISGSPSVSDRVEVVVGQSTSQTNEERSGTIQTTSTYALTGDFTIKEDNGELVIEFAENYQASTALPGLYVYLTNNPSTNSGALEIGAVEVFSGTHTYRIPNIELYDYDYLLYYCKPFNVKVGDGAIEN